MTVKAMIDTTKAAPAINTPRYLENLLSNIKQARISLESLGTPDVAVSDLLTDRLVDYCDLLDSSLLLLMILEITAI